jgi:UDP-3-O-[3-hydroxymyristoyl] glucosamine N-acyltransferase
VKFNNRNIVISETAKIGTNVKIGDNTFIYDNVVIEDNSIICNDCVIGEPLNEYYSDSQYQNPQTRIGRNSLLRSHAIIYAGSSIGQFFQTGHKVIIREHMEIGDHCTIGTFSDLQGFSVLGDYCRLHSQVHVGQKTHVGSFVFVYPNVVFTNDPAPPSEILDGAKIGDFSSVASNSVLLPGTKIGKHSLIGAQSLVGGTFKDYSLIVGNPAKRIKDIRDYVSKDNQVHYPWPYHFSRGMPWEKIGFEKWKTENGYDED